MAHKSANPSGRTFQVFTTGVANTNITARQRKVCVWPLNVMAESLIEMNEWLSSIKKAYKS